MQVLNTGPEQALRVAQKNKGRHKGAVLGLVCTRSGICRYCVRSLTGWAGRSPLRRLRRRQRSGFGETISCNAALRFAALRAGRDVARRGVCTAAKKVVLAKPFLAALHFALLRYALGGT